MTGPLDVPHPPVEGHQAIPPILEPSSPASSGSDEGGASPSLPEMGCVGVADSPLWPLLSLSLLGSLTSQSSWESQTIPGEAKRLNRVINR